MYSSPGMRRSCYWVSQRSQNQSVSGWGLLCKLRLITMSRGSILRITTKDSWSCLNSRTNRWQDQQSRSIQRGQRSHPRAALAAGMLQVLHQESPYWSISGKRLLSRSRTNQCLAQSLVLLLNPRFWKTNKLRNIKSQILNFNRSRFVNNRLF